MNIPMGIYFQHDPNVGITFPEECYFKAPIFISLRVHEGVTAVMRSTRCPVSNNLARRGQCTSFHKHVGQLYRI